MNQKQRITEIAEVLFSEKGIYDTRIIDIANELRISKKTIYKYFEGKDDIIWTIFKEKYNFFSTEIDGIFISEKPFLEKLSRFISFLQINLRRINRLYFREIKDFSPEAHKMIRRYVEQTAFHRVSEMLLKAREDNYLKEDVNIDSFLLLYRDAVFNFCMTTDLSERLPENLKYLNPVDVLCQGLITIFRGILTNESENAFNLLLAKDNNNIQ